MYERGDDRWRTPEELVEIGCGRSRVLMMNEAHDGLARCIRTREIGRRILPIAHHAGARHLAMEALWSPRLADEANRTRQLPEDAGGYLDQPEMRTLVAAALALGWDLIAYEADFARQPPHLSRWAAVNWREETQASNLIAALETLPSGAIMVVWCGGDHLMKRRLRVDMADEPWIPMGYRFRRRSGIDPFAVNQTRTVFSPPLRAQVLTRYAAELEALGGTAGFLRNELPRPIRAALPQPMSADAFLFSTDNTLE